MKKVATMGAERLGLTARIHVLWHESSHREEFRL